MAVIGSAETPFYMTQQYQDLLKSWGLGGSSSTSGTETSSSGTGTGGFDSFKSVADLQFDQTSRLMGLSNQYREKEGATQRQVMDRSAQITEQQRQNDAMRAQSALRNFRKMGF